MGKQIKGIDTTPGERLATMKNRINEAAKGQLAEGNVEEFERLANLREKHIALFNTPIKEKSVHGWLFPLMVEIESYFAGRWAYWLEGLFHGRNPEGPIPKIDFLPETTREEGHPRIMENIDFCLRPFYPNVSAMSLVKWILFSLGDPVVKEMPREVTDEQNEHWYKSFELFRFFEVPGDSMFPIYAHRNTGLAGFFPTPPGIVQMMVEMMFCDIPPEEAKTKSLNEPCCGTGVMLLYASNYSLDLSGQDVSYDMFLMCRLNCWLYVPWAIFPLKKKV